MIKALETLIESKYKSLDLLADRIAQTHLNIGETEIAKKELGNLYSCKMMLGSLMSAAVWAQAEVDSNIKGINEQLEIAAELELKYGE